MNEEQKALLNKAKESLKAAKILFKEEIYDVTVSRTYYAMFYIAKAFLLQENLDFSKHSAVISAFGNKFAKTGKVPIKFHRQLFEAFNTRLIGDYKTESNIDSNQTSLEIEKAEEFLKFAEENL